MIANDGTSSRWWQVKRGGTPTHTTTNALFVALIMMSYYYWPVHFMERMFVLAPFVRGAAGGAMWWKGESD